MELAETIFVLVLLAELLAAVGTEAIGLFLFEAYARLAQPQLAKERRELKSTILGTRAKLQATSSQDEFAQWARLRRQLDKQVAQLDTINSKDATSRAAFTKRAASVAWFVTTAIPFVMTFWYRKSPMYFLPRGWFGPVAWYFSFPSAPAGAVACGMWSMACRRAIAGARASIHACIISGKPTAPPPASGKTTS